MVQTQVDHCRSRIKGSGSEDKLLVVVPIISISNCGTPAEKLVYVLAV